MRKNWIKSCLFVLAGGAIAACSNNESAEQNKEAIGIDLNLMDQTVAPGEDFFRFVNGKWLDQTEIPADQGRWSSFNELREKNDAIVLDVLERAAKSGKYTAGSDEWKAAEFYRIGMDSLKAEKVGTAPLKPMLEEIANLEKDEVLAFMVQHRPKGFSAFFGSYITADRKNSDVTAMHVNQGGLGLPNRDYYTKTDSKSKEIQVKYRELIADMLVLFGYDMQAAKTAAESIYALENSLAEASMDNVERRNPEKTYNKMTVKEMDALTPAFSWTQYFDGLGAADRIEYVIVGQPDFLKEMNRQLAETDIQTVRDYFAWNVARGSSNYLNHEIVNRSFEFYGKTLQGTDEMRARWKRVLASTSGAAGEAIGKLYVDETFPPEAKEKAQEMVDYIKIAFGERIKDLEWMSEETKEKALEKLSKFNVKIGYPDVWKDYSELEVKDDSYVQNAWRSSEDSFRKNLDKLGKPVDKDEWFMTPQTVNAYYSPTLNEIVFPAAILQPPFYDYRADEAVNYGGIGAVIGHEISHGFDDNGSRYDGDGNLKNWWTDEDLSLFGERTTKLGEQYDAYEPLDSVFVNGKFTMGENIGDLGGVLAAYDGLQLFLAKEGRPDEIDGFTPEQRFFISWATVWRTKYKDEALRNQVLTDPHSPGMYRATGPLVNVDAFYEAFNIKEGDAMFKAPEDRVRIW